MNHSKKIILFVIGVILILFIVGGLVLFINTNKPVKIADEVIETLQKDIYTKDELVDDSNTITNNEIVDEESIIQENIEETTSIEVQEEVKNQNNQSNQNKVNNANTQSVNTTNKQPQVSAKEQTTVVETKPQEVTTATQTTPSQTTQTKSTSTQSSSSQTTAVTPSVPTEEFKRNEQMINKIKAIIQNNETDLMKTYGYNIVVDPSIKTLTNQFTFYEDRVINSLRNKFGTIRIYAEDCYKNGQFIMTECYII